MAKRDQPTLEELVNQIQISPSTLLLLARHLNFNRQLIDNINRTEADQRCKVFFQAWLRRRPNRNDVVQALKEVDKRDVAAKYESYISYRTTETKDSLQCQKESELSYLTESRPQSRAANESRKGESLTQCVPPQIPLIPIDIPKDSLPNTEQFSTTKLMTDPKDKYISSLANESPLIEKRHANKQAEPSKTRNIENNKHASLINSPMIEKRHANKQAKPSRTRNIENHKHAGLINSPMIEKRQTSNLNLIQLMTSPSSIYLTAAHVKDIILNSSVQCNLFLAFMGGLPFVEKSTFVPDFLQATLNFPINGPNVFGSELQLDGSQSLSQYGSLVLQNESSDTRYLWFAETRHMMHTLSFIGTPIIHDCLLRGIPVNLPIDEMGNIFPNNPLLENHLKQLYDDTREMLTNTTFDLNWVLSSRPVYINIFDCTYNKGTLDFLTLISHYITNNFSFLHFDMNDLRALEKLQFQPKPDAKRKLQYLYIEQFSDAIRSDGSFPTHTAFAISSKLEEKDKANQIFRALMKDKTIVSIPDQNFEELQNEFEKVINDTKRESMKMSWIFLRSALYFSDEVLMTFDELKRIANDLNIFSDELREFLKTFTRLASLLYLPKITPLQNYIILKPVKFVNNLACFFQPPQDNFNGIFTQELVASMQTGLDVDSHIILETLCFLGLATQTTDMKVDRQTSRMTGKTQWFVPSSRTGPYSKRTSNLSLFIEYQCKGTPPNFQGLFVAEFLSFRSFSLITTEETNVISFAISKTEYWFSLIFHGKRIEILLPEQRQLYSFCGNILHVCMNTLSKISYIFEDVSSELALPCLNQQVPKDYTERIRLDYLKTQQKLCLSCEASKSSLRMKWKEVVHEFYKKKQDHISADKLYNLAMKLSTVQTTSLKTLVTQLGLSENKEFFRVLASFSQSQQILMILWSWERKVGPEQATKQKLSEAFYRMGLGRLVADILK